MGIACPGQRWHKRRRDWGRLRGKQGMHLIEVDVLHGLNSVVSLQSTGWYA